MEHRWWLTCSPVVYHCLQYLWGLARSRKSTRASLRQRALVVFYAWLEASEEGRPPAFLGLKWLHGQWSSFFMSTRPKWNNRRLLALDAGASHRINELFWEPAGSKIWYIHIGMKVGRLERSDRSSPRMELHMNCLLSVSRDWGGWWYKAERCRCE